MKSMFFFFFSERKEEENIKDLYDTYFSQVTDSQIADTQSSYHPLETQELSQDSIFLEDSQSSYKNSNKYIFFF